MLNVITLGVNMLSAIMLSVFKPMSWRRKSPFKFLKRTFLK